MSAPEAVERLRTTNLDELWKSDPQQASIYEDALVVYDERARATESHAAASPEAGPSVQNNNITSPEAEAHNSESTISAPETQTTFKDRHNASVDHEAALILMSLRSGGNTHDYINYGASDRSMGLQAFNPVDASIITTCQSMHLDGVFQTLVPKTTAEGSSPPTRIPQVPKISDTSTRRKGKQPVTYGHSSRNGLCAPPERALQACVQAVSPNNHKTPNSSPRYANKISIAPSTISRVVKPSTHSTIPTNKVIPTTLGIDSTQPAVIERVENKDLKLCTTLRRSKRKIAHDSENENDAVALTKKTPVTSKTPRTSHKKAKTTERSPMPLRSKRKVFRSEDDAESSPEKAEQFIVPPAEEGTQTRISSRSKRKIIHDTDDEDETPFNNENNITVSKKASTEEIVKKSPVLRRNKRKLTRSGEDGAADFPDHDLPTSKRSKNVMKKAKTLSIDGHIDTSPHDINRPTPKRSKTAVKKISTEGDENDKDDEVTTVKKPKQAIKKSELTLVHPPNNLPLKAPANTPGIPDGALALNEHFKKDTPCPLGVQLPINRARTRWEWIPYNSRKVANANFDWADDQQRKDANRFRQQRIRRRLTEHGYIYDGRKNH